jgi:hypothetical protein
MPLSPILGLPYPYENEDPYLGTMDAQAAALDQWIAAIRENDGMVVRSDGAPWALGGGNLSWGSAITIESPDGGGTVTVPAGAVPCALVDGTVCVGVPTRPISGPVAGVVLVVAATPATPLVLPLGTLRGGTFYPRGAAGGAASPIALGVEEYWVDVTHGTDDLAPGRGTLSMPFKTLAWAASHVSAPPDAATFQRAVVFHVASGRYTDPVTFLPYRWGYIVEGDACYLDGDIRWEIDVARRFGSSLSDYPWSLAFQGIGAMQINGDVDIQNVNIGSPGSNGTKMLRCDGNCRITGRVWQLASGDWNHPTGDLMLAFTGECMMDSRGAAKGVYSEDEDYLGANWTRNNIILMAQDSILVADFWGGIQIAQCCDSAFYRFNCNAGLGPLTQRVIEGINLYGIRGGFRNCTFINPCEFGSSRVPPHTIVPDEIDFDATSMASADAAGVTFTGCTPPAVGPTGYVLSDQASFVGADSAGYIGRNLDADDWSVQRALDGLDQLDVGLGGWDAIYVDPINGTDGAANDGSPARPYATLRYAAATVAAPADIDEYGTPVVFVMRPGVDMSHLSGAILLPRRQYVFVMGERYVIHPLSTIKHRFRGDDVSVLVGGTGNLVDYPRYVRFVCHGGESFVLSQFDQMRDGDLTQGGDPGVTHLDFLGTTTPACSSVLSDDSGSANPGEHTGTLHVRLFQCPGFGVISGRWGGTYQAAVPGDLNPVRLSMYDSSLEGVTLCGVAEVEDIIASHFDVALDYLTDVAGAAYTGSIGGTQDGRGFLGSTITNHASVVGWNGITPAEPRPFRMDSGATHKVRPLWTFDAFDSAGGESPDLAVARLDQLDGLARYPADDVVVVRQRRYVGGFFPGSFMASEIQMAYDLAKAMTPGGAALSTMNRVLVVVPPGLYELDPDTGLLFDSDFVDVAGMNAPDRCSDIVFPSVEVVALNTLGAAVRGEAQDAKYRGIGILNGFGPAWEVAHATGGSSCVYQGMGFASTAATPIAVTVDPLVTTTIAGEWLGCIAEDGFGYDCEWAGVARDCTVGAYSFGAGATRTGTFSGTVEDCFAGSYSFGYGIGQNGVFAAGGVVQRCVAGENSFGCTDDTTSNYHGSFQGFAVDSRGGPNSFGWGAVGLCDYADFQGFAERCWADVDSFGTPSCTGVLRGCRNLNRATPLHFAGTAKDCDFSGDTGVDVLDVEGESTGVLYDCTIVAVGAGETVTAANPGAGVTMAHCRLNTAMNLNVTNNIVTSDYTVVDAAVVIGE